MSGDPQGYTGGRKEKADPTAICKRFERRALIVRLMHDFLKNNDITLSEAERALCDLESQ